MKVQLTEELEDILLPARSRQRTELRDVLFDKDLAALGDSYLNFLHSVSLSSKLGRPTGKKIKGSILSTALKESGLRKVLPNRVNRHNQADALEALAAYTWIKGLLSFKKALKILYLHEDPTEGMTDLALKMKEAFEKQEEKNTSKNRKRTILENHLKSLR